MSFWFVYLLQKRQTTWRAMSPQPSATTQTEGRCFYTVTMNTCLVMRQLSHDDPINRPMIRSLCGHMTPCDWVLRSTVSWHVRLTEYYYLYVKYNIIAFNSLKIIISITEGSYVSTEHCPICSKLDKFKEIHASYIQHKGIWRKRRQVWGGEGPLNPASSFNYLWFCSDILSGWCGEPTRHMLSLSIQFQFN